MNRLSGNRVGLALIRPVLAVVKLRNNMQRLDAEARGERWVLLGVVNPIDQAPTDKLVEGGTG